MSEDRPSVRSSVCPYVRPSVGPLSVCQPGPFVRPLNKEGTAHNESQYWQANSNACNDSGQRRRLIRAERQPQSQGFIRWTVDSGHWTVDSGPWTVDMEPQRWGDQVKRNKSSRPVAESHNDWQSKRRTDRSTILHTSTITYGTRRSSIVATSSLQIADLGLGCCFGCCCCCCYHALLSIKWSSEGVEAPPKGCTTKVVKGLPTLKQEAIILKIRFLKYT